MVKIRQSLLLLLLAAITFFFNACTFLYPQQFSKPVSSGADIRMSKNGIISLPGLDLKVVPRNNDYSWALMGYIIPIFPLPLFLFPIDRPQFEILLIMDPDGEDFGLDPGLIVFQVSEGPAISPIGFKRGPGAFAPDDSGVLFTLGEIPTVDCDIDWQSDISPILVSPISVSERTCFLLAFDIRPPPPKKQFTLSIDGVTKAGQPFPIPQIHFKKGWTLIYVFGVAL